MGPLEGVKVIELAGLGPAPFCGMVLADLGAEVTVVDRVSAVDGGGATGHELLDRGKRSIGVDLKHDDGVGVVLELVAKADALIEGFRPGVTERLGLGPEDAMAVNPGLVYGRMTGWGQTGPFASMAGHDINYIALSGVLGAVGPADRPIPPLNLVGDFGGGAMFLALGVVSALLHARSTGQGQVVDAAMVDGSALLAMMQHSMLNGGSWTDERESNLLDGAAPFYTTYETSDGKHVAVGALEPQFFAALLEGLGVNPESVGAQTDQDAWPQMRQVFASRFRERTRDDWADHFGGEDACVAPVLTLSEAGEHPHNAARGTFVEIDGVSQPGPAPRFSVSAPDTPPSPGAPGADTSQVLTALGYSEDQIGMLREAHIVA